VDSGISVTYLKDKIEKLEPASIEFVALLLKKNTAKVKFDLKYVGFAIPNDYVVGYGLDYKQNLRHLPQIYRYS
jgi:hypoxanthine phosphoribosyltransferase